MTMLPVMIGRQLMFSPATGLRWIVLGVCLVALAGCGGSGRPKLVKVSGKVTLDGQPLPGAQVALVLESTANAKYARPSYGFTDANGEFQAQTYDSGDGLPVGKYQVGVIKREVVGNLPPGFDEENAANFNVKYQWTTPRKYAEPAQSGLLVEVTSAGMTPSVIELSSGGQKPQIEQTGPAARAGEP